MYYIISQHIDILLALGIIFPLCTAVIPILLNNFPRVRNIFSIFFTIVVFINIINIGIYYKENGIISFNAFNIMDKFSISFNVEPLGLIFALMASLLWVVTTIYSTGYVYVQNSAENILLQKDLRPIQFFSLMAISMTCTFAIAFAANLFTLFIFYELLTIFTYPLITESGTNHAKKSGRKYLTILMATSMGLLLPAIIYIANATGTLDFIQGGILQGKVNNTHTAILLFCFIYGTGKLAIMPLHQWLTAAMVAPTPVSALLHAVAVVKSGIFTIIKTVIYIFGIDNLSHISHEYIWLNNWLVIAACITIILSSILAFKQDSLKKMLAYSTIGQLSYCIVAISIFTPKAIIAAIFHMVAHAFSKITLFFAAGSIYTSTHKSNISDMKGMGKIMPISCFCFAICALSMIGMPPVAAFLSKYYIMDAAWDSSYSLMIIATLIISTVLNSAYFIPFIYRVFWRESNNNILFKSPPISILIAQLITTILTVLFLGFSKDILILTNKIIF